MSTDNKNVVVNPGTEGVAAKLRANKRKAGGAAGALAATALAAVLVFSGGLTALADTVGNGGNAREAATTNTFAQNMDLQTIRLDYSALAAVAQPKAITGDGLSHGGGGKVSLDGSKLPATGVTDFPATLGITNGQMLPPIPMAARAPLESPTP